MPDRTTELTRVLFVCLGNACRSQMAEGFARTYGSDVLTAASAGLAPAVALPAETEAAMAEKNIDISSHFPKALSLIPASQVDVLVNMSGFHVAGFPQIVTWNVPDPYGAGPAMYRAVRDKIEMLVMKLVLDLRRKQK